MIWRQIRLAGAVMCIVAAVFNVLPLTFIGLVVIFAGTVGAVDRLERDFDGRNKEKSDDETKA